MNQDPKKEIEQLKVCLQNNSPLLYVGAGFSKGSKNHNGDTIPLASGLCNSIYDHFWENSNIDASLANYLSEIHEIAKEKKDRSDLKGLCSCFRVQAMKEPVKKRNEFLTDFFTGCHISPEDSRNGICQYPWRKIFTVNIDDLIERIYADNSKQLNVWNQDNDDKTSHLVYPSLIKLHGCVNNPGAGYVFDDEEYTDFTSAENYLITEFGNAFLQSDVILLGTEFNENDLKTIISSYINKGLDYTHNYFFVTPKINDGLVRKRIENSDNMHHIPFTAEQFFDFLRENIQLENETKNALKAMGLVISRERCDSIPSSYVSKLYHGNEIQYGDLKNQWDISESTADIFHWVNNDSHNKIISLYGKSYVGKTCKAKRILYDFMSHGYECFEFTLNSSDKIELFINYVSTIKKDIAVLFENASYSYELLVNKFITPQLTLTNNRIVIITTDTIVNHNRKYHALESEHCKIIPVTERIDKKRADLIYKTLDEKHSLSMLLDIPKTSNDNRSTDADIIKRYMTETNDIIDVLYRSSLGRTFHEHIDSYFISEFRGNLKITKLIGVFCFFDSMGINTVSSNVLNVSSSCIGLTDLPMILGKINDILQKSADGYHLRYMRFLMSKYNKLSHDEKYAIIIRLLKQTAGRFNEGDYNEHSILLYKLLNFKTLINIFPFDRIKKMYQSVQNECDEYSYYWVQRGLCAQHQKQPDFEEADRFLREARRIRPNSYQVSHAIAKNMIERSLCLHHGEVSDKDLFLEGSKQMQDLIEDERYSKAFSYSLHAYIDSWLNYCKISHVVLANLECQKINSYVGKLKSNSVDPPLFDILMKLKRYAKCHDLVNKLRNVTTRYWKPSSDCESKYENAENDWGSDIT